MVQATFDDGLEEEAIHKRHSMTCEAVHVGKQAKAYRTLLTHFSQRYPKIPVCDPSFQESTCIAFDLMTINLAGLHSNLSALPKERHRTVQCDWEGIGVLEKLSSFCWQDNAEQSDCHDCSSPDPTCTLQSTWELPFSV